MQRIVNAYSVSPDEIQEGDVMLWVVKATVNRRDANGILKYRLYRCHYTGNDIPQGSQVANMAEVCEQLFPSLAMVGEPE